MKVDIHSIQCPRIEVDFVEKRIEHHHHHAVDKTDSIIVVGNGPSVMDKDNGKVIDSFDIVVRFNWFHIKGYENNVGTKTDIWFTTVADDQRMKNQYKKIYVHSWQWNPEKDKNLATLKNHYQENVPVIKVERREIEEIQEYVGSKEYFTYSTGAIAINLLLKQYPSITITGFDWWEDRNKHHYGDSQNIGRIHKPEFEKLYIDKLIDDNKIKFL